MARLWLSVGRERVRPNHLSNQHENIHEQIKPEGRGIKLDWIRAVKRKTISSVCMENAMNKTAICRRLGKSNDFCHQGV